MRWTCLLLCAVATTASAQTVTSHRVWVGANVQARPAEDSPWRLSFDSTVRSRDGVDAVEAWHLRPAVAYDLSTRSSAWLGYAFFRNTPASGGVLHEHRTWQQYLWTRPAGDGAVSMRSRLEQRQLAGNDRVSWRWRQQVRLSLPLGSPRVALVIWDEFAFHLNGTLRTARGFDQNRAFAGVNVAVGPPARVEVGYQNQFVHASGGSRRLNHILTTTLALIF